MAARPAAFSDVVAVLPDGVALVGARPLALSAAGRSPPGARRPFAGVA
jgi:hypothetical protein